MKPLALLLMYLLITQLSFSPAAFAGTFSYGVPTDGASATLDGTANLKRIGALKRDGSAIIQNNKIDIIFATDLTRKDVTPSEKTDKTALSGEVFAVHTTGTDKAKKIEGFAFFKTGRSLTEIDNPVAKETIQTRDGVMYRGHIIDINLRTAQIDTGSGVSSVDTTAIENIRSPRVFKFSLPASTEVAGEGSFKGDCDQITFTPTFNGRGIAKASTQKDSAARNTNTQKSHKVAKRIIICVVLLCLVATAIAVPVALGTASHHHNTPSLPLPAPSRDTVTTSASLKPLAF